MLHLYSEKKEYRRRVVSPDELTSILPRCIAKSENIEELECKYPERSNQIIVEEDDGWFYLYSFKEGHSTIFSYPDEEKDNILERGYNGPCFTKWIYLDFDKRDDVKGCAIAIAPLLDYLKDNKIYHLLFTSGGKGFHIYIPINYIKYPKEYESKADKICKLFLTQLIKQFPTLESVKDIQVYSKTHLFRVPFSSHDKTNKPKRQLKWLGIDESKNYFEWFKKVPLIKEGMKLTLKVLKDGLPVKDHHWELDTTVIIPETKATKKTHVFEAPYYEKPCIYRMLSDKDPHKMGISRHEVCLSILSWLSDKRMPEPIAYEYIKWWNENILNESYSDKELFNHMSSYGTLEISCNYSAKQHYCCRNNECFLWKEQKYIQKTLDSQSALNLYKKHQMEDTSNYVMLSRIFDGMNITLKPPRGHILVMLAAPKVGKTIAALNLMLRANHIHWLFNSLEMGSDEIVDTLAAMLGLDLNDPDDMRRYLALTKHIHISCQGDITLEDQIKIKRNIEHAKGIKIHGMVTDYIQLLSVYDPNRPGKLLLNARERIDRIGKIAKDICKDEGICHIFLSQVPKGVAGLGNTPLTQSDGADSATIERMSDAIISMWRPYKQVEGKLDNVMSMWLCAYRHGPDLPVINYNWIPNRRSINGKFLEEVKQRQRMDY